MWGIFLLYSAHINGPIACVKNYRSWLTDQVLIISLVVHGYGKIDKTVCHLWNNNKSKNKKTEGEEVYVKIFGVWRVYC